MSEKARIFIFVGHPSASSLSSSLGASYEKAAMQAGAQVRRQNLHEMEFDADLTNGYRARKELEPCLQTWRSNTSWATHVVWIFPVWWGTMPAKMK
eukprot:IDg14135t1